MYESTIYKPNILPQTIDVEGIDWRWLAEKKQSETINITNVMAHTLIVSDGILAIWGSGSASAQIKLLTEIKEETQKRIDMLNYQFTIIKAMVIFASLGIIFVGFSFYGFYVGNLGIGLAALGPLMASLVGLIGFGFRKYKSPRTT